MGALYRKLLRDLVRLWPQALAIALVMAAGTATLILGVGTYRSLDETRAAYYERNRFADVFAELRRAPNLVADEIARIDGVGAVETRIAQLALLDLPDMAEPASAMVISIPELRDQVLNVLHLRSGRLPLAGETDAVIVSEPFALAHDFGIGSVFEAILNGTKRRLHIVGTALSPEFIYALAPGELMPNDRRYAIVWMGERSLAAAYDLAGAFSSVHVKLTRGASEAAAIERLDAILARYGGLGAYGRADQQSHAFLDAELLQLDVMSRILPPIFLVIAGFLVNMTLARIVTLEREQIGLLKALGYSNSTIGAHYLAFALVIAVCGATIGMGVGSWLGFGLTRIYTEFFRFPFLVFRIDTGIYVVATGVTLGAAALGAVRAVRSVAALAPAVAMQPPAPMGYRRLVPTALYEALGLRRATVMSLRHLVRWPVRTVTSILGVALAVAVLVGSLWAFGAVEFMIDVVFNRSDRQDGSINFIGERPYAALFDAAALPGVLKAEPFRTARVKIRRGHFERRIAIRGAPSDGELVRVLGPGLLPIRLPETGIALSDALAQILHVRAGDIVDVELLERDRRIVPIPVTAVIEGYLGLSAYMNLPALNALLGEGPRISGVNIMFDSARSEALFETLKSTPVARFITLKAASLQRFRETLAENLLFMISVYVGLGTIIAIGVVYNFARISLSEQGRELASLRVLGFHKSEVAGILFGELAIIALLAQPLGWIIGRGFAWAMVQGFESELYRVPLVIERSVYAWASLIVLASAAVSVVLIRRRIDRLDLIEVLKTRE